MYITFKTKSIALAPKERGEIEFVKSDEIHPQFPKCKKVVLFSRHFYFQIMITRTDYTKC